MRNVTLHWDHVVDYVSIDSITRNYLKRNGGIYLWIIKTAGKERIFYIGEASLFLNRFLDHFTNQFSGRYTVCDVPDELDFVTFLKEHFHGKEVDAMFSEGKVFIPDNASSDTFLFSNAFDTRILDASRRMMSKISFAFATVVGHDSFLDKKAEAKQRKHIEAALILEMRDWYKKEAGKGEYIRYVPRPGCRSDLIIGSISEYPTESLSINHTGNTAGIPVELLHVTQHVKR